LRDRIDDILEQWTRERPDVDVSQLAIYGRIVRLARFLEREEEGLVAAFGVSATEYRILCALRRSGDPYALTPSQLTENLMMSSGGMTKRLDHLERNGLVERRPNPADRRGALIALLPAGTELVDRLIEVESANERRVLIVEPGEREQFADALRRCLVVFEASVSEAARLAEPVEATERPIPDAL
jgi:DNA-binding MarR family transcriptional regulator